MSGRRLRPIFDLTWQSLAYGIGVFGRQVLVYFALPTFTGFMPQEEFGVVAVTASMLAFVNRLSNAGLPAATFRFFSDAGDREAERRTLGSAQAMVAVYAVVAAALLFVLSEPISAWLLQTPEYAPVLRIVSALLLLETIVGYGSVLLRLGVRPLAMSAQNLFHLAAQLGCAVVLVRYFDMGVMGYWTGYLIGGVAGAALMLWLVRDSIVFRVSRSHLLQMARYGIPLVPATLSLWALRLIDRILLSKLVGLESLAVYEVGYKVAVIVTVVTAPFYVAWPPFAFKVMRREDAPILYRDVVTLLAAVSILVALAVLAFQTELVGVLAPASYAGAVVVVPWVVASQVLWGLYPVLVVGMKIEKRTEYVAVVAGTAAAVNIGLNLLLIPPMGIRGAAIATLLGYFVLSCGAYLVLQRFFKFPLDWPRLTLMALLAAGVSVCFGQIETLALASWQDLALRLVLLVAFPLVLIATGFLPRKTRSEIIRLGATAFRRWITRGSRKSQG